MTFTDKRTLRVLYENGGARPPADIPGGRKLYNANLKYLRRMETMGWVTMDPEEGDDFFVVTEKGMEAARIENPRSEKE